MKTNKRSVSIILALLMIINVLATTIIKTSAHPTMLDVEYDECKSTEGDIDKTWYILDWFNEQHHISHTVTTIKYYFADSLPGSTYTWTSNIGSSEAQIIKDAYVNSMKKWNNVYFYSYDSAGNVIKNKIINVVEGTETDNNLIIYPSIDLGNIAVTREVGGREELQNITIDHSHYGKWEMVVYLNHFYQHMEYDSINKKYVVFNKNYVDFVKERTGAHELGHILGLSDVDYRYEYSGETICGSDDEEQHHQEILMGYGQPVTSRTSNITYKDIAGVAITRGFHTVDDHKWLYMGQQEDGRHKLVCSICNGVKYESSLSGFTYNFYNECNQNHELSSGNMMAVASYGTKDYYKCKYCRYVAPFSSNVEQNYTKESYSETMHIYTNNVEGLNYSFLEEHSFEFVNLEGEGKHERSCDCGYRIIENHYEAVYVKKDITHHHSYCMCGFDFLLHPHNFVPAGVNISRCRDCGFTQNVTGPGIIIKGTEDEPVTE